MIRSFYFWRVVGGSARIDDSWWSQRTWGEVLGGVRGWQEVSCFVLVRFMKPKLEPVEIRQDRRKGESGSASSQSRQYFILRSQPFNSLVRIYSPDMAGSMQYLKKMVPFYQTITARLSSVSIFILWQRMGNTYFDGTEMELTQLTSIALWVLLAVMLSQAIATHLAPMLISTATAWRVGLKSTTTSLAFKQLPSSNISIHIFTLPLSSSTPTQAEYCSFQAYLLHSSTWVEELSPKGQSTVIRASTQ